MSTSLTARARRPVLFCCLLLALLVLASEALRWRSAARPAALPALGGTSDGAPLAVRELSQNMIPAPGGMPSAHASTLASAADGTLLAFWWAGSRESGPDVKVFGARWDGDGWSDPWEVASRASLAQELGFGVRRIGNPVAFTDQSGAVHLYVVATGLGGWAAARIAHLVSTDNGERFSVRRLLPTSPLFNTSTLVRTAPVGLADGGWWLPLYFEIGNKYPMMMGFDKEGNPHSLARIGTRTAALQPAIVPVSATEVRALMRDSGPEQRLQHASSLDGGASWRDLPPLDLPNHDTSLAVTRLPGGQYLMLHNHAASRASARSRLRLSLSTDLVRWTPLLDVASGKEGDEFSYPSIQQVGDEVHVTYTWQRGAIAHHRYRIVQPGEKP